MLDDNKMLCLSNGERIKLTSGMRMVFEVDNLMNASPATVSRCGMVFLQASDLGWRPYAKSWLQKLKKKWPISQLFDVIEEHIWKLFEDFVDSGLAYVRKNCKEAITSTDLNLVQSLCRLFAALFTAERGAAGLVVDAPQPATRTT